MSELTVYATTNDGYVRNVAGGSYAAVHDAASGNDSNASADGIYLMNDLYQGNWYISRGLLYFDTSGLPDGAVISAATLSLYTYNLLQTDAGHADVHVVEGVQADPFTLADYGNELSKTASGGSVAFGSLSNGNYTDFALNSTGISWINKTGTTRFCIRLSGDKNASQPTYLNEIFFRSAEKGTGYKPKLVVTYSEAETKTSSDSGSGSEATGGRELGAGEAGSGAEANLAAAVVASSDGGSGADFGGLLQDLFGRDEGGGADDLRSLTHKAGADMRLGNYQGQVGMPNKEVSI